MKSLIIFLCFLAYCNSFVVEPWYANLNHFGPLANDGWNARPMTLIADYTYRISNLSYIANQPYMFVSSVLGKGTFVLLLQIFSLSSS